MKWWALTAIALGLSPAHAGIDYPPVDLSSVNSAITILQGQTATIPVARTTVPAVEQIGGAAGTAGTYLPGSAVQQRITQATTCTLASNGRCTVTWASAFSATPTVAAIAINTAGVQPVMCNPVTTPTTTSVTIGCWIAQTTTLSLSIITAGLNLAPATNAPTGMSVVVIGLPPSQ